MADRRRLVTLSQGGRPVLDLDLEVTSTYQAVQDTFAYQPGNSNQQASREPGRYGGQEVLGEQNDNGTVSWQALVRGSTPDQVAANAEAFIAAANRSARGRMLEWRPDGATYSNYFRIAGPASWKPTYQWRVWNGAQSMLVDFQFPVRPLVLWDPMTVRDFFDVDSLSDYTVDAAGGTTTVTGGQVKASTSLSSERRYRHTVRGYPLLEGQGTVYGISDATTVTGYKLGVLLRASASDTYVEVYVDDNGTNSRLRIDVVIAGVRTNRATTNLSSRVSVRGDVMVRGRIEGNVVTAEEFDTPGSPLTTPSTTNSYTLVGGELTSLVAGHSGWSWVPQHANALIDYFDFRPFVRRSLALPQEIVPTDAIPGTAPALVDVLVTPGGGSARPLWAMIGWGKRQSGDSASSVSPVTIMEAENANGTSGDWVSTPSASDRGGNVLSLVTSGVEAFSADFDLTAMIEADDFTDAQIDIEVWARVLLSSTLASPRLAVSSRGRYTSEFGSAGRLLTKPTSGTVRRFVRLGVVTVDALIGPSPELLVEGSTATGSSGQFAADYLLLVPARRRACLMTGVDGSSVSSFMPDTSTYTKRVRSDLSTTISLSSPAASDVEAWNRSGGLGGALIQPSPGYNRWLVKLSSLVPDDPTVNTDTEQTSHTATVSLDVTPRSYMLRGA